MLTSDEFAAVLLIHGVGADCTVGFTLDRDIYVNLVYLCFHGKGKDHMPRSYLTSIILLFLVIIPKLTFALSSHATLSLLHLVGFALSRTLVSLIRVKALDTGARMRTHMVVVTN